MSLHTYICKLKYNYYMCTSTLLLFIITLTCNELRIVKIQANNSESLLATNNSPNIHVPPSNGKSAKTLNKSVLHQKVSINIQLLQINISIPC